MNKKYIYAAMALALSMTTACSNDEDTTPSYVDTNGFMPSDDDQSEVAVIRREFRDKTGCYLLFNDTLSKQQKGIDANGNPYYDIKYVDVNYSMVSNSYDINTYKYIADPTAMRKAAQTVKDKLVARLGSNLPFSFLLVDTIYNWKTDDYGNRELSSKNPYLTFKLGSNCCVVSLNGGLANDDDAYFKSMVCDIVYSKLSGNKGEEMTEFYAPVIDYVDKYKDDLGYQRVFNDSIARTLGFYEDWSRYYFCIKKENDLKNYLTAVFTMTDEEFDGKFSNFPICQARFQKLKEILKNMGVKID